MGRVRVNGAAGLTIALMKLEEHAYDHLRRACRAAAVRGRSAAIDIARREGHRVRGDYLSRELTGVSYPAIGRRFGGKDHTSVIHACRRVVGDSNLLSRAEYIRSLLTPDQPPALIAASRQPT